MRKRWLCVDGFVPHAGSLGVRFVASTELPGLYGVPAEDCLFADDKDAVSKLNGVPTLLVVLRPDPTGQHQLPVESDAVNRVE